MASARIYTAHDDHVLCRTRGALYILAEDNGRTMGALRGVYARILPTARMASPLRKVRNRVSSSFVRGAWADPHLPYMAGAPPSRKIRRFGLI